MKNLFLVSFSFLFSFAQAQNLVPNPSFETHTSCTGSYGFNYLGTLPDIIPPWYSPTKGTPDYFNHCYTSSWANQTPLNVIGYQHPRTGNAYAGIGVFLKDLTYINYREYIQVPLSDTLQNGKKYCISFYISYSPFINSLVERTYAITEIGLYVSDTAILLSNISGNYFPLPVNPQITSPVGMYLTDTLNWVEISGDYTAHGGEKYITIGNFKDDANTDTLLMAINSSVSTSSPERISYYYVDDVSVIDCTGQGVNEIKKEEEINIFPNPATSLLTISTEGGKIKQIKIYNIIGECVLESPPFRGGREGLIDLSNQPNGIYFVEVETEKGVVRKKVVKK